MAKFRSKNKASVEQRFASEGLLKWYSITMVQKAEGLLHEDLSVNPPRSIEQSVPLKKFTETETELRSIFDFERSSSQRQGSKFFLGKWNS